MEWVFGAFAVFLLLALYGGVTATMQASGSRSTVKAALATWPNFTADKLVLRFDLAGTNGLALDLTRGKVILIGLGTTILPADLFRTGASRRVLVGDGNAATIVEEIGAADILEVELIVDGHSVTKTSRGSQVLGAALGGAVFGGVGAIIGGLSGTQTTKQSYEGAQIQLMLAIPSRPIFSLSFNGPSSLAMAVTPGSIAVVEAGEWHTLLKSVVSRCERPTFTAAPSTAVTYDSVSSSPLPPAASIPTLGEQLSQLGALRAQGQLTAEEFEAAKRKLLM